VSRQSATLGGLADARAAGSGPDVALLVDLHTLRVDAVACAATARSRRERAAFEAIAAGLERLLTGRGATVVAPRPVIPSRGHDGGRGGRPRDDPAQDRTVAELLEPGLQCGRALGATGAGAGAAALRAPLTRRTALSSDRFRRGCRSFTFRGGGTRRSRGAGRMHQRPTRPSARDGAPLGNSSRRGSRSRVGDHARGAACRPMISVPGPRTAPRAAARPRPTISTVRSCHTRTGPGQPLPCRPPTRRRQARAQPTSAITSSLTSKLAQTFCTSSLSSSASMRRNTFFAPSASSGIDMDGRNVGSAES
jgi:hypothetical protein